MRKYLDLPVTIIIALALTVAMLWPVESPASEGRDKLVHLIAFAALTFPLGRTGRFGLLPVFISASAFGGIIELIQPIFNRSSDINDWVADIVGAALGIGCGLLYWHIRRR